ncbi:MAG: hypothetical protein U0800_04105 [Isosphaeraceae bacterium]
MNPIVAQIAKATGLEPGLVEKGLGILLNFVKSQDPERFGKILDSLPGAGELMGAGKSSKGEDAEESAGGGGGDLLGGLLGMAGKILGGSKGGDAASLLGSLSQAGFTAESAADFLPQALKSIQDQAPPGALDGLGIKGIPSLAEFLNPAGRAGRGFGRG